MRSPLNVSTAIGSFQEKTTLKATPEATMNMPQTLLWTTFAAFVRQPLPLAMIF